VRSSVCQHLKSNIKLKSTECNTHLHSVEKYNPQYTMGSRLQWLQADKQEPMRYNRHLKK